MAVITKVKKAQEIIEKGVDNLFKKKYKGAEGSPFKNVDDLGSPPIFRNPKDLSGTEKKKLKEAGEKIKKFFKKDLEQKRELRNKASKKMFKSAENKAMGGRIGYKSGMGVCKLAKRGKGRAYGKNS